MRAWFGKLSFTTQFVLVWVGMAIVGTASVVGLVALGVGLAQALGAQSATEVTR